MKINIKGEEERMASEKNILCLDIGSGTQDVLCYQPDQELENCPKFILPSPAKQVAGKIQALTKAGKDIYLYGQNMGGGFGGVLYAHLQNGLQVAAHPEAALALADNLEKVVQRGISLVEYCPLGHVPVYLTDFDPGWWSLFLTQQGLPYPDLVLACVQDHGYHPQGSNRKGRFELWERFLHQDGGRLDRLLTDRPDPVLTRLLALQRNTGFGPVADTGGAAVLGALFDSGVWETVQERGICVVNIGNSHTIAFLVFGEKIWGVYEQHTGLLTADQLWLDLERFKRGELSNAEVFAAQGHGCAILEVPREAKGFVSTYLLGPRRALLKGYPVKSLAPGGDMMLTGCFGLLKGWTLRCQQAGNFDSWIGA